MKKLITCLLIVILMLNLVSCGPKQEQTKENALEKDWDVILKEAKGTTVNFYGWGGDERINKWIDEYLSKELKKEYDITLKRVPMNIEDILNKLLGEKQIDSKEGTIDIVWINGENFYSAKEAGLLYGPFSDKLPNFNKYLDKDSVEVKSDFGFPVEGYEVPYGKAQFVMIYDRDKLKNVPKDHHELMSLIKENPGKFTYPAPPDFTGSAFVRNIIYDIVGYERFMNMKPDKEVVKKEIAPAIEYLKEIKPYLWKEGKTYPSTIAQLDNMYSDNEVFMSMTYNPLAVGGKITEKEFKDSTNTFVLDKGTIGNTHFLAIPFNSTNKEGALSVINYILSVNVQASKYDSKNWGDIPVLDNSKLNDEEKAVLRNIPLGQGVLSQEALLNHRLPEMPANLIPIIEEIWQENIPEGE